MRIQQSWSLLATHDRLLTKTGKEKLYTSAENATMAQAGF